MSPTTEYENLSCGSSCPAVESTAGLSKPQFALIVTGLVLLFVCFFLLYLCCCLPKVFHFLEARIVRRQRRVQTEARQDRTRREARAVVGQEVSTLTQGGPPIRLLERAYRGDTGSGLAGESRLLEKLTVLGWIPYIQCRLRRRGINGVWTPAH